MRKTQGVGAWASIVAALLIAAALTTDGDAQALVSSAVARRTEAAVAAGPATDGRAATEPAPAAAPAEPAAALEPGDPRLETPPPAEYMPNLMRCRRYRGRRFCEGPRRVPVPHGEAAALAAELELETKRSIQLLLYRDPPEAILAAVEGESHELHAFPVDGGRLGRTLIRKRGRRPGHEGADLHGRPGSLVRALDDGLVVYSDNGLRGYGNAVVVLHPDGTVSLYAHLQAAYLFAGQQVLRGQVLGELGETGLARGPHLHLELRRGGVPMDPSTRLETPRER